MKTCPHCDVLFESVRHQKFCSVKCGKHYRQRLYRAEPDRKYREQALQRRRYHEDYERHREYAKRYYRDNAEKETLRHAKYVATNIERLRKYRKARYKDVSARICEQVRRRDARLKAQSPILSEVEQLMVLNYYERAKELTETYGVKFAVDHIIPINCGGLHAPWNLQVVLASDNSRKRDTNLTIPHYAL